MPERSARVLTVNMHEGDGRPAVGLTPVVCPDESAPFDILKGQLRMLEGFDEPIAEMEADK